MLEKLEFMIALAREQHFGRAAESCGVAQPTLSLGIQSLEQMLNTPLVKRASRFQGFTPEGERVLMWAHRLVGDARAMRQDLLGLKDGSEVHLRIAAIPSAMPLVARITVPLQMRYPNVRFTVLGRTSNILLDMLRQREIEAGVTYLSNEPIGEVSAIPIYREEYLLLTTAEARSATRIASRGRRRARHRCAFSPATCRAGASSTAFCGASASSRRR